jgi:hypothetical protein
MRSFVLFVIVLSFTFSCMNKSIQYEYADGSGNRYIITQGTLSYIPVTPEESSSGMYSGGDPKEILLKGNQYNAIRSLLDNAITKNLSSSIHMDGRVKMSGLISVVDQEGRREYILKPGSEELKAIEALLSEMLEQ